VDDFIIVIGEPNATGQIEAKFIRVMPTNSPEAKNSQFQQPVENNFIIKDGSTKSSS
jgi:hypothetical protein